MRTMRGLRRADVGHERIGRRHVPHPLEQVLDGAHGRGEHDEVGLAQPVREVRGRPVERAVVHRDLEPGEVAPDPDDLARDPPGPRRLGHGAPEQPDADHREATDHARLPPSTARSPLMSRRFSSGVPMVIRSAVSIPNDVMGRTMTPSCSSF